MRTLYLYTDGGSRNNPGPSAVGVIITDESSLLIQKFGKRIKNGTNFQAEYSAVIAGLAACKKLKVGKEKIRIIHFSDCKTMIDQLNGQMKIKENHLLQLARLISGLRSSFFEVTHSYIPRTNGMIQRADDEVNAALDGKAITL